MINPNTDVVLHTDAIVRAVNVANDFRALFGEAPIDDLPQGVKGDSERCILARAFNFNCKVGGMGHVFFYSRDDDKAEDKAHKLATLVGTEVHASKDYFDENGEHRCYCVTLPVEIAELASLFDRGALPEQYYSDEAEHE